MKTPKPEQGIKFETIEQIPGLNKEIKKQIN